MSKESVELNVNGFSVKKYTSVEGKNEDDPGVVQIVLVASKSDIKVEGAGHLTAGDVLSALHTHQSIPESVTMKLRFFLGKEDMPR